MTTPAVRGAPEAQGSLAVRDVAPSQERLDAMWYMAERVAESNMFACRSPSQAFALMLLCDADGLHPMQALRRYHLIDFKGSVRPSMRSDAVQAEMQAHGWEIRPLVMTEREARAVFTHPQKCPHGLELGVTWEHYQKGGLTNKDTWKAYPDDMLWARLVTKACRRLDPGIIAGIYSPEELEDAAHLETPQARHALEDAHAAAVVTAADPEVMGYTGTGPDERPYHQVVTEAVAEYNHRVVALWLRPTGSLKEAPKPLEKIDVHRYVGHRAMQLGFAEGPLPTSARAAIEALAKVYKAHREWVRTEVEGYLQGLLAAAAETAAEAAGAAAAVGEGAGETGLPWEPGAEG